MCGIAGFWDPSGSTEASQLCATVNKMRDTLIHRGPDGADTWIDAQSGIGLGHRRLSILDLSPAGSQPMHSASKRFVMIFNGEIYNHQDIKLELTAAGYAPSWRGHSDTEIMLAAIDAWGVETAVKKFVGMFAIALWDSEQKLLYLIRDRIGEKPLYYGWCNNYLLFGSELKSLRGHFAWEGRINKDALSLFSQFNYIPAPHTIYENIHKVLPGHMVIINDQKHVRELPYWQLKNVLNQAHAQDLTPNEAIDQLEVRLKHTISQQMLADVSVGAFLSGGIDSSTIVALMQAQSTTPVKTFSIGFSEALFNEAQHAKKVAEHLKTDHTDLYFSPVDAQAIIAQLASFYDEPFADSSQLPTMLVAKLTRQFVKVSLSGDGGDELFGGYNRYRFIPQIWQKIKYLPKPARDIVANLITTISPKYWDKLFALVNAFLPSRYRTANPGDKMHKAAHLCSAANIADMYTKSLSTWSLNNENNDGGLLDPIANMAGRSFTETMMYMDMLQYLPDDILVKVDRAGMAVSLETRMPFLDHRVVEYAWGLPLNLKLRGPETKWILRRVLERYVPHELYARPKAGFAVPLDQWLRGPLKSWAQDLLSKSTINAHNLLDHKTVEKKWQEHNKGTRNWQHHLWNVLSFQSWYEMHHG